MVESHCGKGAAASIATSGENAGGGTLPAFAFEMMLGQINDHVMLTNRKGTILYVNDAFERVTGYSREEAVGNTPRILKSNHHSAAFYEDMWKIMLSGEIFTGEVVNRRKSGELYYVERMITPIVDAHKDIEYYMSVGREITDRTALDPTTGLPNRATLKARLAGVLEVRAKGASQDYALINVNIRHFNRINNSFGYTVGDRLLRVIADRLLEETHDNPHVTCVAYLGADAFAVVVENLDEAANVVTLATMLQVAIAEPVELVDVPIFLAANVGIAIGQCSHQIPDDIIGESDSAGHRAKELESDIPVLYDVDYSDRITAALRLESALRRAIDSGEFMAHYQPIYTIATGMLDGFEALARWYKSDGTIVSPGEFIPVAEKSGLIVPLGEHILKQACHQAKLWQEQFGAELKVSVNLSAHQFMLDDLVERIRAILQAANLRPGLLKVEITESATIDNPEAVIIRMHELKRLGVELLMDDFGTGYSSLGYLTRYPLDILKIDRSFVTGSVSSEQKRSVIKTIISLAHGLGMKVIAEGVETDAQLKLLREHGCDKAQGYLFGRPMDVEAVNVMLAEMHVGV
jgi:PAS domain S-box-containing protein/diguanylate cyclase (GGDEF)-like protein